VTQPIIGQRCQCRGGSCALPKKCSTYFIGWVIIRGRAQDPSLHCYDDRQKVNCYNSIPTYPRLRRCAPCLGLCRASLSEAVWWLSIQIPEEPQFLHCLFHALEQTIPNFGTDNSTLWNRQFQSLERTVPRFGIIAESSSIKVVNDAVMIEA
jgi:hypothetical protein